MGFKVPLDETNEPRNILEEIVWWVQTHVPPIHTSYSSFHGAWMPWVVKCLRS
jgi:hypothetical protein